MSLSSLSVPARQGRAADVLARRFVRLSRSVSVFDHDALEDYFALQRGDLRPSPDEQECARPAICFDLIGQIR
ncbi:hypothetical protein ACFOWX_09230 [Sphingorhabdus arenilitoris]|uniref:Uncharacterized protein n=1 Tax=Sphingorhabdus arenilitoris TaxID=1490041 RepID=A0ABV8RGM2_9SPHN